VIGAAAGLIGVGGGEFRIPTSSQFYGKGNDAFVYHRRNSPRLRLWPAAMRKAVDSDAPTLADKSLKGLIIYLVWEKLTRAASGILLKG
jgi:hypothetical protein